MSVAYRARFASSAIYHNNCSRHHNYRPGGNIRWVSQGKSRAHLSSSPSLLHQPRDSSVTRKPHHSNPLQAARLKHEALPRHRCEIQTYKISSSAYTQKSAMPLPADDDNEDVDIISSASTSTIPFLLADIGEGISEVELLQWYVNAGDTVSQFDRICEVQSDKANVEITSRFDGVIEKLCGQVGDMMFVGKPLLYIVAKNAPGGGQQGVGSGGNIAASTVAESGGEMKQQTTLHNVDDERDRLHIPTVGSIYPDFDSRGGNRKDSNSGEEQGSGGGMTTKVLSSPAVRKISKENNIDLGTVLGTGPGGRVLKSDILNIINAKGSPMKKSPATITTTTPPKDKATPASSASSTVHTTQSDEDTIVPIRGYNRLMVKSMTASLQVPHMVYADEINVNALTDVRDSLRPLAKEMGIQKLTYLPFFIKASSLAISKYPVLNSTIDVNEMTLTYHNNHNIGVAVDTERGLAVPVVKKCQDKSVLEIAEELSRLYSLVSPDRY